MGSESPALPLSSPQERCAERNQITCSIMNRSLTAALFGRVIASGGIREKPQGLLLRPVGALTAQTPRCYSFGPDA
jgi:hypothetical protein